MVKDLYKQKAYIIIRDLWNTFKKKNIHAYIFLKKRSIIRTHIIKLLLLHLEINPDKAKKKWLEKEFTALMPRLIHF